MRKAGNMTINGVDISKYGAKQLTVDIAAPDEGCSAEWAEGSPLPRWHKVRQKFGTLQISVLFRGAGRDEILRSAGDMIALLDGESILRLDGYAGEFVCYYTGGAEPSKIARCGTRYTLSLEFKCYRRDTPRILRSTDGAPVRIFGAGSRTSPAEVSITAATALSDVVISGFPDGDIGISGIAAGETIIIDGAAGTVTSDGADVFSRVDLWGFPVIPAGRVTNITLSAAESADGKTVGATMTIKYRPMLLI